MSRVAEARVGLNVDKLLPVGNVDFLDLFKSYSLIVRIVNV